VGDSASHDVTGAKSAGFQALLLERGRKDGGDGVIGSLLELEGLVGEEDF
jgi:FMN phosphatase YigB (HAD superfamily)